MKRMLFPILALALFLSLSPPAEARGRRGHRHCGGCCAAPVCPACVAPVPVPVPAPTPQPVAAAAEPWTMPVLYQPRGWRRR
jgi:hypothetical protein